MVPLKVFSVKEGADIAGVWIRVGKKYQEQEQLRISNVLIQV